MSSKFRVESLSVLNNRSTASFRSIDGLILINDMQCRWRIREDLLDPEEDEGRITFSLSTPIVLDGLSEFAEEKVRTLLDLK